jgi:hypothetical protein
VLTREIYIYHANYSINNLISLGSYYAEKLKFNQEMLDKITSENEKLKRELSKDKGRNISVLIFRFQPSTSFT